ncbi:MAG: helix-turn-helix domain-containing protein [Candidatus Atabeyarchaeum deiterrae]
MDLGDFEDQLVFYGLSKKEAKIYLYLLKSGAAEVLEISRGLDITRADIYKHLNELEGKGICREILSHPTKFEASPLNVTLETLILKQKEKTETLSNVKDEVVSALGKVSLPTPEPKFQILQGREPTTNKIRRIRRSSNDVVIYVRERTLTFLHTLGLLDVSRIAPGLSIRILSRLTPKTMKIVEECGHCRFRNIREDLDMGLPEFAVFDKKEALVALSASDKSAIIDKDELALWSDSHAPVMLLVALFEKMWENGEELNPK